MTDTLDDNDDLDDISLEVKEDEAVEDGDDDDDKILSPEDGFAKLNEQLEAERNRRIAAERREQEAAAREAAAKQEKDDTEIQLVSSAIDSLQRDAHGLKYQYEEALRSQDFRRAADINEQMQKVSNQLDQLEKGLESMRNRPKVVPMAPTVDPVESLASQLSPKSATWIREHPEYVRDPVLNRRMLAAHDLAVTDGMVPDSDQYFEFIETSLRIRKPQKAAVVQDDDAMATSAKVVQRRDAGPAAAPVSRGTGTRKTIVTLTRAEREAAEISGMKPDEYFKLKQKIEAEKKGRLN